jgi:hypothetical protein
MVLGGKCCFIFYVLWMNQGCVDASLLLDSNLKSVNWTTKFKYECWWWLLELEFNYSLFENNTVGPFTVLNSACSCLGSVFPLLITTISITNMPSPVFTVATISATHISSHRVPTLHSYHFATATTTILTLLPSPYLAAITIKNQNIY